MRIIGKKHTIIAKKSQDKGKENKKNPANFVNSKYRSVDQVITDLQMSNEKFCINVEYQNRISA